MTRWAIALLVIAFLAAIIGFGGLVVDLAASIARIMFFFFLILFLVALFFGRRLTD